LAKRTTEQAELIKAKEKEAQDLLIAEYPLMFLEMNRAQKRIDKLRNKDGKRPRRLLFEAGNKIGKTRWGLGEDLAHAFGFRPWLLPEHPDFKIDIPVPNNGMIGCETMMHSVPEKIEPELKRLIPKHCEPVFRLNPQGVVKTVTLTRDPLGNKCGSVIHIRSYDQRPDTFEGIDFDWIHWDEPPPKDIFQAAERGKVVTNAPSWFTMTPLKEPYIYDQFSLKSYSNGGDDDEIGVVRGAIWDNCRDYCKPCDLRIAENETERVIRKCPKCGEVMGFIPQAGIIEYLKNLDPEEREAREFGKWHHLSGLVYKEIDRQLHVYEDFLIPKNWMRIEAVDPHDARPVHWLFGAVSPEEIEILGKKRHRIYWYDYALAKGDLDEVVRQVKSKRALHGYDTPYFVVLDKKFGEKTQMEERSWQTELERRGIVRMRLSHSSPGDVELGHKLVREYLKPQFSTLLGTAKPGMLFSRQGCTGTDSPFHAMCNYQYKENKDKPEEAYKDWCDCVRYAAMEQPSYKAPEDDRKVIDFLSKRNNDSMKQRRISFAHN
jgi:phage terminase large subunit-like protein